jgi:hypothetical protein
MPSNPRNGKSSGTNGSGNTSHWSAKGRILEPITEPFPQNSGEDTASPDIFIGRPFTVLKINLEAFK